MPTVLSFERHPVTPANAQALESLVSELVRAIREAPGALWAQAAGVADDEAYLVLSEWRTAADLDAFEAGEAATRFDRSADPLRVGEPTRRRFESL